MQNSPPIFTQSLSISTQMEKRSTPLVLAMPGTGFDHIFAKECFYDFAEALGFPCEAVQPDPCFPIESIYHTIADRLAERDVILAGISISTAIAVQFACELHRNDASHTSLHNSIMGIIAALPAWTGGISQQYDAPAQLTALETARSITNLGVNHTIAQMQSTTPAWLAQHLTRSWSIYGENLAQFCQATVSYPGPTLADLQKLSIPLLTIGLSDDPIHPASVAREWAAASPYGVYRETTLHAVSKNLNEFSIQALAGYREIHRKCQFHC